MANSISGFQPASLNTGTPPADTGVAKTVALTRPAQRRLSEGVIDFLTAGAKKGAQADAVAGKVEQNIARICSSDATLGSDCHQKRMESFQQLRQMAQKGFVNKFDFDVTTTQIRDASGKVQARISYSVSIDNTTLIGGQIDQRDRDSFLSFHRALATTQLLSTDVVASPSSSVQHDDAVLLTQFATFAADEPTFREASGMADLAASIDDVNQDPRHAVAPHAAMGEKVRILAERFPHHCFNIALESDREAYAVTVRGAHDRDGSDVALVRHKMAPDDQAQFPSLLAAAIKVDMANRLTEGHALISNRERFIDGSAQTMCEDSVSRAALMAEQKNPAFSSATFTGVTNETPTTFTATFGDRSMVFSNRASPNHEMRGATLKEQLLGKFDNLAALMAADFGSARDSTVLYLGNACQQSFSSTLADLSDQERTIVHQQIGDIAIGGTTLREVWKLPSPSNAGAAEMASANLSADAPKSLLRSASSGLPILINPDFFA